MNNYPPEFYTEVLKHDKKKKEPAVELFDKSDKLVLALRQLDSISSLVRGNEYESYLMQRVISMKVELQRQYNVLHNINAYA